MVKMVNNNGTVLSSNHKYTDVDVEDTLAQTKRLFVSLTIYTQIIL